MSVFFYFSTLKYNFYICIFNEHLEIYTLFILYFYQFNE